MVYIWQCIELFIDLGYIGWHFSVVLAHYVIELGHWEIVDNLVIVSFNVIEVLLKGCVDRCNQRSLGLEALWRLPVFFGEWIHELVVLLLDEEDDCLKFLIDYANSRLIMGVLSFGLPTDVLLPLLEKALDHPYHGPKLVNSLQFTILYLAIKVLSSSRTGSTCA